MKLEGPKNRHRLVSLPYDKTIYLCKDTFTRWQYIGNYYVRDLNGEDSWKQMGAYMGLDYKEVFLKEYNLATGE